MQDQDKTKEQLIDELRGIREMVSVMEATEARLLGTEKALRESEERFRLLYENAPLGYQSLDENGRFLEVNQAWLDTLGYAREEVIGRWFGDFLAPGYQDHFKINFPKFKAAGEIHWVEFEMLRKDGSQITVAFDGQIGRDEQGRFRQTHCILHDISEIKRSQDAVKESEQRYRAVVDNVEVGISLLNSNMEIVEVNKALKRYFPHVRPACGQICYEQYNDPPRSEPCSYCPCVLTLQDGEVHDAVKETPAGSEIKSYHLVSSPIKDSDGRVQYVIELTEDITERKKAQESLDRANQEWERTFNAISDLVMVLDSQHKILRANKAMVDALGMTEQELIGKLCFEVVHGKKEPPVFCPHSQLLADGEAHSAEVVEPRLGGTYDVRVSPLTDQNGQVIGSVHVTRDISDRKRVEEALQDSEERLRLTLEATQVGIWDWDVKTDQWYASPIYYTMLGYEPHTGLADRREWLERVHPDDRACVNKKIQDVLTRDFKEYQYEARLRHADGDYRWQHVQGVGIKRAEDGKVTRMLGIRMDITERKRAEEALRESEGMYRSLVTAMAEGVVFQAADGRITAVNPAAERMEGRTAEQMIGRTSEHPQWGAVYEDGTPFPGELHPSTITLRTGEPQHGVVMGIHRPDGALVWISINSQPLVSAGEAKPYAVVTTFHDITERRQTEEALLESEEKYRTLFEESFDGLFITSPEGKILDMNKKGVAMFGYDTKEEMMALDLERDVYAHPPDRRRILSMVDAEGSAEYEIVVKKKNSEEMVTHCALTAVSDEKGEINLYRGIIRDITDRKRAEEQIKQAEEFLNSVVDNLPIAVFAKAAQNGQFMLWNKAAGALFGFTKEQVIGKTDYDFFPKEQADFFWEKDRDSFASGEVLDIPEEPILTKNLDTRVLHTRKVPVYDKERQPFCLLGISEDITDHKRAENIMLARLRLVEYATSHSLDELLQATLDEVEVLTDSSIGFYHFVEADQRTLRLQAWSTRTLREMCTVEGKGLHYDISEAGVWVDCVHERRPVIHNDYSALPHRKGMPAGHANVIRELVVPVFRGDRLVAVLGVGNKPVDYSGSDIETVSLLADLAWDIAERKLAEEALRAASLYNRSLIEASLDPLVTISAEGRITDVNTATERVTGYSRQDLIGTDFADYFSDPEKARAGYQEAFKVGSVSDYELEIRHRKSGLTSVMYNASVYHDRLGKVAGLFAAARNITKQKRAEQALQHSEEQYRAVFHNAGIGIKVVNRDRRINRANPALLKMLGYSDVELKELAPVDITHPDDREITNQYLDAILGNGPDSLRLEKRYIRKDGSVIWGDVSISAMRDAHGNRIAALEVIADITDRTKSQIALQESEKRMRRIIDSSPVGIRITQDARHVYANRALARIFGYESQEEILGLPAEALFAPESRALVLQRVADRMTGKTIPTYYEASGMTRQGKTIALESWGTEIEYLGKKSWLAFIIDISEAKSLRAQLLQAQKMEAVGTLAGGIAHDFNNILQVVLGFSEILLMGKREGDKELEDIQKILSAARKGADLVKGLLAFSRKVDINPKPLNLNQLIQQAEAILARTIPKTIKIDLMLEERLSAISADPFQIEQILLNFAINARDAMPEGGRLTFETSNVTLDERYSKEHLGAEPGDYVLLTVSDTGQGMTKETLEHIFEPFFSTKPAGEGTGLGLAMVYGIVKQHSGLITCYSEPGIGTTFKLYFPVIEMKGETRVREEVVRFPGGTETILLVDDEDLVRELAKRILSRAGYTVLAATNGREALQVYKKERKRISLVLLDLIMPEMDGKQCLKELLKLSPGARVLVASGYSANGPAKEALEIGARGFVSKPFDMGQLLQTVRKVLDEA